MVSTFETNINQQLTIVPDAIPSGKNVVPRRGFQ